jgi:hypothetical protein
LWLISPGSWQDIDGVRINRLPAPGASQHRIKHVAAIPMTEQQRATASPGRISIAPMPQAGQHRVQIQPGLGQPVFVTHRSVLVRHLLQHAVRHQLLQPVGQDVTRDAQPLLKRVKAANPQEAVAQDEQGPPVTDHGNRAGDRASLLT